MLLLLVLVDLAGIYLGAVIPGSSGHRMNQENALLKNPGFAVASAPGEGGEIQEKSPGSLCTCLLSQVPTCRKPMSISWGMTLPWALPNRDSAGCSGTFNYCDRGGSNPQLPR